MFVTERGGRTSHAAIVARELGIPAIVGAAGAMDAIATGRTITICCAEGEVGRVYDGLLKYDVEEIDVSTLPHTHTQIMMNVGNPEQAFKLAQIPNDGVGLARMEFIFASWVRVHPLALTRYDSLPISIKREVDKLTSGYADKTEYFVETLARGIGPPLRQRPVGERAQQVRGLVCHDGRVQQERGSRVRHAVVLVGKACRSHHGVAPSVGAAADV